MDTFERFCHHVLAVHSSLRTGLQVLIESLNAKIPQNEVQNYLGALEAYLQFLVHHHRTEDEFEFPALSKRGFSIVTTEFGVEHKSLNVYLEDLQKLSTGTVLDQVVVKNLLLKVQEILVPHLQKEEAQLTPEALKANGITEAEINEIEKQIETANKKLDGTMVLPILYCKMIV
jgi:hemerythrin-like domain-containing protein